jgi:UDP-glucose 4-epimerase
MTSRRILITGLSTHWGGRLAQALEGDPAVGE